MIDPARVTLLDSRYDLTTFSCGRAALDNWLRNSARVAASAGTAATYLALRGDQVVGYYALAMSAVTHQAAPSRLRRGMPDPVPVVLLARLAVHASEHGQGLGGHLLVDALRRCVSGARMFGARAVVVDALDEPAAAFYRHFGFHDLAHDRLWRRIGDIAADLAD
jgi:predicted N-acetyltransferase YhbS